jgi:flagellar protein FlbT
MGLRLTLKPNERVLVNGCVIRNANRRQTITIENTADVVRESDLLSEAEARSPVKEVYFFIQASLLDSGTRERLVPLIQKKLGKLVPVFHDDMAAHAFEAANYVSQADFYKAMRALKPLMDYEAELLAVIQRNSNATAAE